MRRWIAVAALLLALGTSVPAWPGEVEDCHNALDLLHTEPAKATTACRHLADRGDAFGQNMLGAIYITGQGSGQATRQDMITAYMWFSLAAIRAQDLHIVASATQNRDFVGGYMTPTQIAQAKALAAAWKPTTGQ